MHAGKPLPNFRAENFHAEFFCAEFFRAEFPRGSNVPIPASRWLAMIRNQELDFQIFDSLPPDQTRTSPGMDAVACTLHKWTSRIAGPPQTHFTFEMGGC